MKPLPQARPLYDSLARGWNTRDVRPVSTHGYLLPEGLGATIGFAVPSIIRFFTVGRQRSSPLHVLEEVPKAEGGIR